jgi:hypothetical protein
VVAEGIVDQENMIPNRQPSGIQRRVALLKYTDVSEVSIPFITGLTIATVSLILFKVSKYRAS